MRPQIIAFLILVTLLNLADADAGVDTQHKEGRAFKLSDELCFVSSEKVDMLGRERNERMGVPWQGMGHSKRHSKLSKKELASVYFVRCRELAIDQEARKLHETIQGFAIDYSSIVQKLAKSKGGGMVGAMFGFGRMHKLLPRMRCHNWKKRIEKIQGNPLPSLNEQWNYAVRHQKKEKIGEAEGVEILVAELPYLPTTDKLCYMGYLLSTTLESGKKRDFIGLHSTFDVGTWLVSISSFSETISLKSLKGQMVQVSKIKDELRRLNSHVGRGLQTHP